METINWTELDNGLPDTKEEFAAWLLLEAFSNRMGESIKENENIQVELTIDGCVVPFMKVIELIHPQLYRVIDEEIESRLSSEGAHMRESMNRLIKDFENKVREKMELPEIDDEPKTDSEK